MVSGQWSVVSGQWSVVSGRWSVVSGQFSVVGGSGEVFLPRKDSECHGKSQQGWVGGWFQPRMTRMLIACDSSVWCVPDRTRTQRGGTRAGIDP